MAVKRTDELEALVTDIVRMVLVKDPAITDLPEWIRRAIGHGALQAGELLIEGSATTVNPWT